MCGYEECLKCLLKNCGTGQIAREQGEEAYRSFLTQLDKAEELLELKEAGE